MIKWPIILFTLLHYLFAADFKILSFNIHALHPIIANDNPKGRLIKILKNTTNFEFIFFQENWIFSDNYLTTISPNYNWFVSKDSGLTIGAFKDYNVLSVENEFYDDCSGWLFKANDCLASKGFQKMTISIDNEILDFYNTHLDAGNSESDFRVRELQVIHLLNYIISKSDSRPIILVGDLNINYLADTELHLIHLLRKEIGLKLVNWFKDDTNQSEVLDYIFYRDIDLYQKEFGINQVLDGLSDHPPIESRFILFE
tara:strand:- start:3349 stop:4119 length:771 start_codon:yes stop_codon:yes gene_type:complete